MENTSTVLDGQLTHDLTRTSVWSGFDPFWDDSRNDRAHPADYCPRSTRPGSVGPHPHRAKKFDRPAVSAVLQVPPSCGRDVRNRTFQDFQQCLLHTFTRHQRPEQQQITVYKPREIKEKLDEYVIGQDQAKRALSVAV